MDERVATCQDLLNMINGDKKHSVQFITGDERCCFAYGHETKRQSYEWFGEHSALQKKLPFQKSRAKTMLIVFFDSQGNVHKQFVQEGCTVNAQYYKVVFDRTIWRILPARPALYFTRDSCLPHHTPPPISQHELESFWLKNKPQQCTTPPTGQMSLPLLPVPECAVQPEWCNIWYSRRDSESRDQQLNKIPSEEISNAMKKLEIYANRCITFNWSYFNK
jgi:hypothetical protein